MPGIQPAPPLERFGCCWRPGAPGPPVPAPGAPAPPCPPAPPGPPAPPPGPPAPPGAAPPGGPKPPAPWTSWIFSSSVICSMTRSARRSGDRLLSFQPSCAACGDCTVLLSVCCGTRLPGEVTRPVALRAAADTGTTITLTRLQVISKAASLLRILGLADP